MKTHNISFETNEKRIDLDQARKSIQTSHHEENTCKTSVSLMRNTMISTSNHIAFDPLFWTLAVIG